MKPTILITVLRTRMVEEGDMVNLLQVEVVIDDGDRTGIITTTTTMIDDEEDEGNLDLCLVLDRRRGIRVGMVAMNTIVKDLVGQDPKVQIIISIHPMADPSDVKGNREGVGRVRERTYSMRLLCFFLIVYCLIYNLCFIK